LRGHRAGKGNEGRDGQDVTPLRSHESSRLFRGFAAKTQNNVTE
jgi:hypothetical protein